jgi:hypothetical protein
MGHSGNVFADNYMIAKGNALAETALSAADYPASGSYIDVSGYERAHVLIHLGTIDAADLPTFEIKCAEATNGTADSIDTTTLLHTCAADDDGEFISFTVEVMKLPLDHHFLTCTVAAVTNGSYGDIVFLLEGLDVPVTQTTAVLPTASKHVYAG